MLRYFSAFTLLFVTIGLTGCNDSNENNQKSSSAAFSLYAPNGFDFSTDFWLDLQFTVSDPAGNQGYISIYTDYDAETGEVNRNSRIVFASLDEMHRYQQPLRLANHIDDLWVEVWYVDNPNQPIKTAVQLTGAPQITINL